VDLDRKGYISAQDIERLAEQVGEPITTQEAETMMMQSKTNKKLYKSDFRNLLAPPSP
jgi:Ca2+-binding EF-hand superfamily protein